MMSIHEKLTQKKFSPVTGCKQVNKQLQYVQQVKNR